MKKIFLALSLFLLVSAGRSQDTKLFDKSSSTIPENDLWSIALDNQGRKWIGSAHSGLLTFDGTTFTTFTEINGVFINPIFKDSKGNMWVNYRGPEENSEYLLARFDGTKWWSYKAEDIGVKDLSIGDICEDKDGTVYFAGCEGVIVKIKDNKWELLNLPKKDMVALSIDVSDNGSIAVGLGRQDCGLLLFEDGKWSSYSEKKSPLVINVVRALKFTDDGSLIIGYGGGFGDGGFSVMKGKQWTHYNKYNSGITDHMVCDIEFDGKDYWMATNNGLAKFDGIKVSSTLFREGMFRNVISDITIEDGTIWIATNFGLIQFVP